MIGWYIASVPFWAVGAALVWAGWNAPFDRRPGETNFDLVGQWFLANLIGGTILLFAAWICS